MSTFNISFTVTPTGKNPLGLTVVYDDQVLFDQLVVKVEQLSFDLDEDENSHELKFILHGKLPEHTKIDQHGQIVSDSTIDIDNLKFDDVELDYIFQNLANYQHDFNSNGALGDYKFYGAMGCNGTVSFKFYTPFYLWLLENM